MNKKIQESRRQFLGNLATFGVASAVGLGASTPLITSCAGGSKEKKVSKSAADLGMYSFVEKAPNGKPLTAGLIGCGSRGTGAALQFLAAGEGLKITYLADILPDKMESCRQSLAQVGNEVKDENCFMGFDSYKKMMETDVDIVLLVTPTCFRPIHFQAAVQAGKHIFMEKPCAVDPVGVKKVIMAAKQAKAKGLTVVTGNQRRHRRDYWEAYIQIQNGIIGDVVGGSCHWDQSTIWQVNRTPAMSDVEYCIRNWFRSRWVAGDAMLDLLTHNLDIALWFMGARPESAIGYGGCAMKNQPGDIYDFFSIEYTMPGQNKMSATTRCIDNTQTRVGEFIRGTKGSAYLNDTGDIKIVDNDGKLLWQWVDEKGNKLTCKNPYEQEHIHLVESVRKNLGIMQAEDLAMATMTAILGREAAYSGQQISWEEVMASNLQLNDCENVAFGPLPKEIFEEDVIPIPGTYRF